MPLKCLDKRGNTITLTLKDWSIDNALATALLYDEINDIDYTLNYPFPVLESEDYNNSKLFLFKNRFGSKEDHCFEINVNKKRHGIIFPVKVFLDPTTTPPPTTSASIKALYGYFHVAFYQLLTGANDLNNTTKVVDLDNNALSIVDFYDEETVVFLNYSPPNNINNIENYLPSFFSFGYVPINKTTDYNEIHIYQHLSSDKHPLYEKNLLDKLSIKEVTSLIIQEKYIIQIFSSTLKFTLTPYSRFLLLYQVIELLINKLALEYYSINNPFNPDLNLLIDASNTSNSFFDLKNFLTDIKKKIDHSTENVSAEIKRINKLFIDKCSLQKIDYLDFVNSTNLILENKDYEFIHEYVYYTRNKIVHDYHTLSITIPEIDNVIAEANFSFEKIITDIVISHP